MPTRQPKTSSRGVVRFRERRPATKWTTIAATVAAVLFVGAGAFAGAMMQPYLADRAMVATKLTVARTAANAITTLWTYTPENIDKLADRASQYLSGDFQAAYRKYLDALIAPNKQAKVTNTTQVVGAAVESLNGTDADRDRLHQHGVDESDHQGRAFAEVSVVSPCAATGSRALAGHQDDHDHLAGPHAQVLIERQPARQRPFVGVAQYFVGVAIAFGHTGSGPHATGVAAQHDCR